MVIHIQVTVTYGHMTVNISFIGCLRYTCDACVHVRGCTTGYSILCAEF